MTIGQKIKATRKNAGLTQKELAQKMGLSFQSIAQWENDLRKPKIETLKKIADALECPIDTFTTDDFDEEIPSPSLIGRKIRDCRIAVGLTQQELATKIGVDGATVGRYERGELKIKAETLKKIEEALGIGVLALWRIKTPEQAIQEQEEHKKEVLRNRAIPGVIELLKAIYGECEYISIYQRYKNCHLFGGYYALGNLVKKTVSSDDRRAFITGELNSLVDIFCSTTMAAVDALVSDEYSVQEEIGSLLNCGSKDYDDDVLEMIEKTYKESNFDREIPVEELDLDPAGDDLAPDDPGEADPAEKA